MIQYLKFTESNEHEGEKWRFYIPVISDLEEKIEKIEQILALPEFQEYSCAAYHLSATPISETKAVTLVKHQKDDCGYMHGHNLVKDIELPEKIDLTDMESLEAIFYKGGCWVVDKTAFPSSEE